MWVNLLKTWAIEIPILRLFLRQYDRSTNIVGLGIMINASTWTFLTYYYCRFGGNVYLLETILAIIEGLWIKILWPISWWRSMAISFFSNVLSFGLGWWGLI